MPKDIQPLRPKFWVFFFLAVFSFFTLLFGMMLYRGSKGFRSLGDMGLYFMVLLMFTWGGLHAYLIALRRYCRGQIDMVSGCLTLKTLWGEPVNVQLTDIAGFSACRTPALWGNLPADGVVLYLKSGQVIELSDTSIKPIQVIVESLKTQSVPYLGEERSWYPIKKRRYKFTV